MSGITSGNNLIHVMYFPYNDSSHVAQINRAQALRLGLPENNLATEFSRFYMCVFNDTDCRYRIS